MEIERIAKIVIPSSAAISLGMEMILSSFMLSTLELNTHPYTQMVEQIEQEAAQELKTAQTA